MCVSTLYKIMESEQWQTKNRENRVQKKTEADFIYFYHINYSIFFLVIIADVFFLLFFF